MSQINEKMFASNRQDWGTPQALFDSLNEEFHFVLDAAANADNFKVFPFLTEDSDGLTSDWMNPTWCNPPYGRDVGKWVLKAYMESLKGNTVVMLLYARTDTQWFHEYVMGKAEIRFLKGRIKFEGAKYVAPFPSMIVIWHGNRCKYKRDDGICEKLSDGYGLLEYCVEGPCIYDSRNPSLKNYVEREYICRNNVIDRIERHYRRIEDEIYQLSEEDKIFNWALDVALDIVVNEPSADVRENVRGRWEVNTILSPPFCCCSVCGAEYCGLMEYNFCPNCGADMRGEQDG